MTDEGAGKTPRVANRAELGRVAAIWNAICAREIDFYPRVATDRATSTLDTRSIVTEMDEASAHWSSLVIGEQLNKATDLAKQALAEVKAQTEYQDQKATRLLTITTILSALSGVLFSRFEDVYPIETIVAQPLWVALWLGAGYLVFAAFVVVSLSGALVTFHATRTRFKYPAGRPMQDNEDPVSLLFYAGLIRSRPKAWMNGWVKAGIAGDADKPMLRDDLQQRYFRNLVSETYLVAAKTADKLRYLEPAQSLLENSLRCLLLCILFLTSASVFIKSTKPAAQLMQVRLVPAPSPPSAPINQVAPPAPSNGAKGQHP